MTRHFQKYTYNGRKYKIKISTYTFPLGVLKFLWAYLSKLPEIICFK